MEDDMAGVQMNSVESFWGKELSSKNKVYEWDGEQDESEGIESVIDLRVVCLGVAAKPNERNVIAVQYEDENGEDQKHVIASLTLDKVEQVNFNLPLTAPFKLELLKGSGPVHLTGKMTSTLSEDFESEDSDDSETEEAKNPFPVKIPAETKPKKRPVEFLNKKPSKVAKKDEEEDDEDVEEDTSMEFEKPANKKPQAAVGATEDESDAENEDESEDNEDSDIDDNDDSDVDEEESAEEIPSPQKKGPKVGKLGNKSNEKKSTKLQQQKYVTPQPTKATKQMIKTPKSLQAKSKGGERTGFTPKGTPSIDEIKKKLLHVPNIPKKLEKFNNFLKGNYKVTDDNVKKQLWEHVQKNRK